MISVIIACKNEVNSIENTLLSILCQSYKHYEIIVIDGLSTDGTLDVIEKYKDKISYYTSEQDNGIYNAMNKGIKMAKGNLLYFLNANDTLCDEKVFEKVHSAFVQQPDRKMLVGDVKTGHSGKYYTSSFSTFYSDYYLFYKTNFCHQGIFYKKELFEKLGSYDEKFNILADQDINMNFLIKNKIPAIYLEYPIANYSIDGISSSLKHREAFNKEKNICLKRYYKISYYFYKLRRFIQYFFPKLLSNRHKKVMNIVKIV